MKNWILFLVTGFWMVALGVLVVNRFNTTPTPAGQAQIVNNATGADYTPVTNDNSANVNTPATPAAKTYTMAQVAQHGSAGSCWMVISGSVYDVTSYMQLHPGGANRILMYCGKEATQAFATMGGQGVHSSYAYSLLKDYLIGKLG